MGSLMIRLAMPQKEKSWSALTRVENQILHIDSPACCSWQLVSLITGVWLSVLPLVDLTLW